MTIRIWQLAAACLVVLLPAAARATGDGGIEPHAGKWKTWVIASGADFRVPPPPSRSATRHELRQLADLIAQNDESTQAEIAFWDAGSPAYRWMDMVNARILAAVPTTPYPHRVQTYVAIAMYDATIAAWESKYHYNRPRPSRLDHRLPVAVEVPDSPSYPSDHAAAAHAAALVLGHFLPAEAAAFQSMAERAGWSRVLAGVQYPSDYEAGRELGRRIAERVIAKADADGSLTPWMGTVPTGACKWVGTNPGNAAAANWAPLLLHSPDQFRPPAPPPCNSPQVVQETALVRNFPRTFATNYKAYYWQSPEGLYVWPYKHADKWMFEDGVHRNPPRAARAYALLGAVMFDAFIASQDGKFAYWYLRPHQNDSMIVPLFPVPNFPSYPSNHSTFSAARSEMLAYLFPTRAEFIRAVGAEAGDSRIWAGIHYPMDNVAGVNLGRAVAAVITDWAGNDGSNDRGRAADDQGPAR
jgi:membrane-associated phospholipid phosphatase